MDQHDHLLAPNQPARLWTGVGGFIAWVALLIVVRRPHHLATGLLDVLVLINLSVAAYAWGLYASATSAGVTFVIFLTLLGVWMVHRTFFLGLIIGMGGLLLGAIVIQQRHWQRQRQRFHQLISDLEEDQVVKEQALAVAEQSHEALQKKQARYRQLQSIAEALNQTTDLTTVAQLAVDRAFELIGKSQAALFFLVQEDAQALSLFASKKQPTLNSIQSKHGDQFDRYVLRTHRPLLVNDVRRDFRFTAFVSDRRLNALMAVPLLIGQRAEGILRLESAEPGTYTQDDLRFLDILLDLVATGMTNAKLFARTQRLAMTDGLTGLLVRRSFLEQFSRELLRAERNDQELILCMLDVDEFKRYNDRYGHPAGDVILRLVGEVLRQVTPPDGVIARYGGEEFTVLLPHTSSAEGVRVAEQIRLAIETAMASSGRRDRDGVTVSIGVAAYPQEAHAELELIRVADQRLYQAKRAGRNRVCAV